MVNWDVNFLYNLRTTEPPGNLSIHPTLDDITCIHPTGIVTSNSTWDRISSCLRSWKDCSEARTGSTTNTTTRSIIVCKKDMVCVGSGSAPLRPKRSVKRGSDNSILENNSARYVSFSTSSMNSNILSIIYRQMEGYQYGYWVADK